MEKKREYQALREVERLVMDEYLTFDEAYEVMKRHVAMIMGFEEPEAYAEVENSDDYKETKKRCEEYFKEQLEYYTNTNEEYKKIWLNLRHSSLEYYRLIDTSES